MSEFLPADSESNGQGSLDRRVLAVEEGYKYLATKLGYTEETAERADDRGRTLRGDIKGLDRRIGEVHQICLTIAKHMGLDLNAPSQDPIEERIEKALDRRRSYADGELPPVQVVVQAPAQRDTPTKSMRPKLPQTPREWGTMIATIIITLVSSWLAYKGLR